MITETITKRKSSLTKNNGIQEPTRKRYSVDQPRSGALNALQNRWKNFCDKHQEMMANNVFHDDYKGPGDMTKEGNANWGVPTGKTLERGMKAHAHIENEIQYLLDMIMSMASFCPKEKKAYVTFKQIFDRYVRISDKVVGILMRAKKRKLVTFESEMLWQGRDDHVKIYVLKDKLEKSDPKWLKPKRSRKDSEASTATNVTNVTESRKISKNEEAENLASVLIDSSIEKNQTQTEKLDQKDSSNNQKTITEKPEKLKAKTLRSSSIACVAQVDQEEIQKRASQLISQEILIAHNQDGKDNVEASSENNDRKFKKDNEIENAIKQETAIVRSGVWKFFGYSLFTI